MREKTPVLVDVRRGYGTDGPYSLELLHDMLNGGAVPFDDIVWVVVTGGWVRLTRVDGIYLRPAPERGCAPALVEEASQTRPWVRYWARSIDIALICIIVGIPIGALLPDGLNNRLVYQLIQFL